jgi:hypothetical protein
MAHPLCRSRSTPRRAPEGGYHKASPTRFDVNPRLAAKFAALAERERERRAAVREAIAETVQARRSEG